MPNSSVQIGVGLTVSVLFVWLIVRTTRWAKKRTKLGSMLAAAAFPFPEQPPPHEQVEHANRLSKDADSGDPDVGRYTGNLSGMTVNERLFSVGLLHEFEAAAQRRDREAMLALLKKVELSAADAAGCVDAVLLQPTRFGA